MLFLRKRKITLFYGIATTIFSNKKLRLKSRSSRRKFYQLKPLKQVAPIRFFIIFPNSPDRKPASITILFDNYFFASTIFNGQNIGPFH